ncbi:retrotransposon protein, putative, ty1-copia subclass, partial [Tanacetum coccineum]
MKKFSMQNSKKSFISMEVKHDLSNEMCASSDEEKAYMKKCYGGNPDTELDVYRFSVNASWQCDKDDTKSQMGYVFVVNGGAVDWKSKKQTTIAMHATQSEYMAASEAAMEAVWIRKFVGDLGVMPSINKPINMYCDNSAAIIFANEPGVMKGARHFLRRYHYVREQVESGEIKLIKMCVRIELKITGEALTILDRMETYGCAPNRVTISTFINGLCKEDKPDEANKLIDRCVGTCSVSKSECYSSLVVALLRVRNFDEAENVFRRMLVSGLKPDGVACSELLKRMCLREKRVRDAFLLYNEIDKLEFATTIDSKIYSIMLDGLCTKIHLLEASKLAKLMAQKSIRLKPPDIKSVVEYLKSAGEMEIFAAVELCSPRSFVPCGVSFQASRSRNEAIAEQSRVCIGIIEDESRNRFEFVSEVLLLIEVEKELETH